MQHGRATLGFYWTEYMLQQLFYMLLSHLSHIVAPKIAEFAVAPTILLRYSKWLLVI